MTTDSHRLRRDGRASGSGAVTVLVLAVLCGLAGELVRPFRGIPVDPARRPALQEVWGEHVAWPSASRAVALRGPRVAVELPVELRTMPLPPDLAFSARTAFVWACRVIDAAERWAGHSIAWGTDGTLVIRAFGRSGGKRNSCYNRAEQVVELGTARALGGSGTPSRMPTEVPDLDAAAVPDVVSHEAAHAVVFALKPGWGRGTSLILAEALADATAFLVAAGNPDVAQAARLETGGDYAGENAVSRLGESTRPWSAGPKDAVHTGLYAIRSARSSVGLSDVGLDATATAPALWPTTAGTSADPHHIGSVVCGALYELFVGIHRARVSAGAAHHAASSQAAEVVGTLMLRALAYVGEHNVSFDDYARALLRVDENLFASRYRVLLSPALRRRDLLARDRCGAGGSSQSSTASPVRIVMDPALSCPDAVLGRMRLIEWSLVTMLARYRGDTQHHESPAGHTPPLYHDTRYPFRQLVSAQRVRLHSDSSSTAGPRVIRIAFSVSRLVPLGPGRIESQHPEIAPGDFVDRVFHVYASLVFDNAGFLVQTHADRPWR